MFIPEFLETKRKELEALFIKNHWQIEVASGASRELLGVCFQLLERDGLQLIRI